MRGVDEEEEDGDRTEEDGKEDVVERKMNE